MILSSQEIAERCVGILLAALGQFVRAPGFAHQTRGPVAVAFGDEHAGERENALGAGRLVHREGVHGGRVALLLPQPRLCAPAQLRGARPIRIGGEEGGVTLEIRRALGMAQHEPVGELLSGGIGDAVAGRARIIGLALAREVDGVL